MPAVIHSPSSSAPLLRLAVTACGVFLLVLGVVLHFTVYDRSINPSLTCYSGEGNIAYNGIPVE
jgi:hypothetical protein